MNDLPSPGELVRAHRTIRRLQRWIAYHQPGEGMSNHYRDVAGMDVWSMLVEAHRAVAVGTHCVVDAVEDVELARRYHEAWERMLKW